MMAFIPVDEDDTFSQRAWTHQVQQADPTREVFDLDSYTAEVVFRQFHEVRARIDDQFDEQEAIARNRFGHGSASYSQYMKQLRSWRTRQRNQQGVQYFGVANGELEARIERPASSEYVKEIINKIGVPGTEANTQLKELNPELVGFMEHFRRSWLNAVAESERLGDAVRDEPYAHTWWLTQEITRPLKPGERPGGERLRAWFVDSMDYWMNTQMRDQQARLGAQMIMERWMTPMFAGYDLENPLVIPLEEVPGFGN
jgi:hypothetical protein